MMPKVASPSSRARNDASPRDLIKILRANMSSFDEQWKTQDVESFVNTYQELLVDLLQCHCQAQCLLGQGGCGSLLEGCVHG